PGADQDIVIAGLLRRLWRTPSASCAFRPLSEMIASWCDETLSQAEEWTDSALVSEGLFISKELAENAPAKVLLATDLHAGNVLRAERKPWLVIDPKPFIGDPAYDATQHLFNCMARLQAGPDELIGRMSGLMAVDSERVRLWLFARAAAEPRDHWAGDKGSALAKRIAP